jgi:hypothetical protein
MDFTNHPLSRSSLDNRDSRINKVNQSIIDNYTTKLRNLLRDETLDSRMVAKIVQNLSEADIHDFADYALRKANHPGKAFVKLCHNAMEFKSLK